MAFLVSEEAETLYALFPEGVYLVQEQQAMTERPKSLPEIQGAFTKKILFWYENETLANADLPLLEKILAAAGLGSNDIGTVCIATDLETISRLQARKLIVMGDLLSPGDLYSVFTDKGMHILKSATLDSIRNDVAQKTNFWNSFKTLING